jgi:hypothetical protein
MKELLAARPEQDGEWTPKTVTSARVIDAIGGPGCGYFVKVQTSAGEALLLEQMNGTMEECSSLAKHIVGQKVEVW